MEYIKMKVRDLLEEIKNCKEEYGEDFLDWDIYTEQIDEGDKQHKKTHQDSVKNWGWVTNGEKWEYFECAGFWTKFPKEKIFTINVNY